MTETTTTAAWERSLDRWNCLPGLDEESIDDRDYLLARVRHILDEGARAAASERARTDRHDREIADAMELHYLRRGLESLAEELRGFTRAGEERLAMLRRRFPDMRWERERDGIVGYESFYTLTPGESAARCARHLRLRKYATSGGRDIGWHGPHEGISVIVHRPSLPGRHHAGEQLAPELVEWLLNHAPELPPLYWNQDRHIRDDTGTWRLVRLWGEVHPNDNNLEPAAVAARWADTLALGKAGRIGKDGRRAYLGETEIGLIQIEWIASQARLDAYRAELDATVAASV